MPLEVSSNKLPERLAFLTYSIGELLMISCAFCWIKSIETRSIPPAKVSWDLQFLFSLLWNIQRTSVASCNGHAGSRMGAHNAEYIIRLLHKWGKKRTGKPSLAVISVDYQLSNPTNYFTLTRPSTTNCMPNKTSINKNSGIWAQTSLGKKLISKPLGAHSNTFAYFRNLDEIDNKQHELGNMGWPAYRVEMNVHPIHHNFRWTTWQPGLPYRQSLYPEEKSRKSAVPWLSCLGLERDCSRYLRYGLRYSQMWSGIITTCDNLAWKHDVITERRAFHRQLWSLKVIISVPRNLPPSTLHISPAGGR